MGDPGAVRPVAVSPRTRRSTTGASLAADVFFDRPPARKGSKYTVLADPKHVNGLPDAAPIVKTSVVTSLG